MKLVAIKLHSVTGCLYQNQAAHNDEVCGCQMCRAKLVSAFAHDLAVHFGDDTATKYQQSVAHACAAIWKSSGGELQDLLKFVTRIQRPDFKGEIKVTVTDIVDSSPKIDLRNTPTEGSA